MWFFFSSTEALVTRLHLWSSKHSHYMIIFGDTFFFLFVNVYWDFFAKKICMIKNNLFKSHCVGYLCWDFSKKKKTYIKLRRVDFRLGLGASCLMLWSHDIFTTHFQKVKNWLEWNANKVQFDRSIKKNGYESERERERG